MSEELKQSYYEKLDMPRIKGYDKAVKALEEWSGNLTDKERIPWNEEGWKLHVLCAYCTRWRVLPNGNGTRRSRKQGGCECHRAEWKREAFETT